MEARKRPVLLEYLQKLFPTIEVTMYKEINKSTIQIWCNYDKLIFRYKSPVVWSLETLKSWQKEMKGD